MCSLRRHSYCLRNRVVVSSSSSSLANEQPPGSRSSSSKNVFNSNEAGKEWNTNLRATCEAIVKVNEADDVTPELSLASYMRLPVEQQTELLNFGFNPICIPFDYDIKVAILIFEPIANYPS